MKLLTIGDSISQGFMSGAAARTDLAYSTLIARSLKLSDRDYSYPNVWGAGGLPLNLENLLRQFVKKYSTDISGLEWIGVAKTVADFIDQIEDYYERGKGSAYQTDPNGAKFYHNIAVQGFDVADSWLITPKVCREAIARVDAREAGDGFLSFPSATFYRTALKVLNPSLDPKFDQFSALEWIRYHAVSEGLENLIVWLGANNSLGTVLGLSIRQTPNDGTDSLLALSHQDREQWNLWHPNDFTIEYTEFLNRLDDILQLNRAPNCNVFIGTIPLVTIAPLAKGVGPTTLIEVDTDFGTQEEYIYYKYYTYFFREEEALRNAKKGYLTLMDALYIDNCIRQYNKTIKQLVAAKNEQIGRSRYHIVDTSRALQEIAFKRNAGRVKYKFPEYFKFQYPPVNTKYYHADEQGRFKQGGLFSLDGIHPSAIGQGLIAYEFLKVMKQVGVTQQINLDWDAIFRSDSLYSSPIPLMHELYENDQLAELLVSWIAGNPASRAESFHLQASMGMNK
jgi:hypothetical protein